MLKQMFRRILGFSAKDSVCIHYYNTYFTNKIGRKKYTYRQIDRTHLLIFHLTLCTSLRNKFEGTSDVNGNFRKFLAPIINKKCMLSLDHVNSFLHIRSYFFMYLTFIVSSSEFHCDSF